MAEALLNVVIEQLVSATTEWLKDEISMIKGVERELYNMSTKMLMIQKVLDDAQSRSLKEKIIQQWLEKLQDLSYEMEDMLDAWNTIVSKQKLEETEQNNSSGQLSYSSSCSCLSSMHSLSSSSTHSLSSGYRKKEFSCLSMKQFSCFSSVKQVGWRRDIASRIKIINEKVDSVSNQMNEFKFISSNVGSVVLDGRTMNGFDIDRTSTSLVNESLVHGRDAEKEGILRKLLCEGDEELENVDVVSIVGVGGLGKTTLAQLVYNDERVIRSFDKRIWVCVSNMFDEVKVAKGILEGLGVSHLGKDELQTLHQCIRSSLSKHKFLLVLDDVWNEELGKWTRLRACLETDAQGSKILITTRSDKVARITNTREANMLRPKLISESDCWLLMSRVAFQRKEKDDFHKFEKIGKEISKKCNGLPLAAKTLGGLLILKDTVEEWKEVLYSEIWELEEAETELFPHLFLSYKELPAALKRCFLFFSIFPKGYEINVEELISLWFSHGYIYPEKPIYDPEHVGQGYFRYLLSRSFFQVSRIGDSRVLASMHDIMHDFALYLSRNNFLTITEDDSNSESTSLKHHKSKKAHHLFIRNRNPFPFCDVGRLRTCLADVVPRDVTLDMLRHLKLVRTLSLRGCDLDQIPPDIGKLIHLRTLDLSCNYSLRELPETIGDLYNLKCLFLVHLDLVMFPQSIGKLINLRLLAFDLEMWKLLAPESLGKLTNLQKLSKVHVEAGSRGLGFLKNLNQIHEDLEIVFDSDYIDAFDASEANLKRKKHVKKLTFDFNRKDVAAVVVGALEPPTDVTVVKIVNFRGTKLPSWINSLDYLTTLELSAAENIISLPPLGKIPYLEKLKIHKLLALKSIGRDFMGIDNNSWKSTTIVNPPPASSFSIVAFPALEELELSCLDELEKWEDLKEEEEGMINVVPKLKKITIQGCPKLEVIPHRLLRKASSLKRLLADKIELPSNRDITGEEVVEGKVVPLLPPFPNLEHLNILNHRGLRFPTWITCLDYLTDLSLYNSKNVTCLPPLGKLPSLQNLAIHEFSVLNLVGREFLGIEDDNNQKNIISTCSDGDPSLPSSSTVSFPKLEMLEISNCRQLEVWEDLKPEEAVDDAITLMPNLYHLAIHDCPKLEVMPHRLLLRASSLRALYIPQCCIAREKIVKDVELLLHVKNILFDF